MSNNALLHHRRQLYSHSTSTQSRTRTRFGRQMRFGFPPNRNVSREIDASRMVASQVASVRHPDHHHFQDFGDMMLRGNNGFGYVRLDWFTPYGLGTWGDGRPFILGTDGYMEARKHTNVAVSKQGNHLFVVDQEQARYIDAIT